MKQTIAQQRAKFALAEIKELQGKLNADEKKEFSAYASGLAAMIHSNGLGQTLAFYQAKGNAKDNAKAKSHQAIYQLLSKWLTQETQIYQGKKDALEAMTESSMADYQLAQAETLELISWVKKFAKAFLTEAEK